MRERVDNVSMLLLLKDLATITLRARKIGAQARPSAFTTDLNYACKPLLKVSQSANKLETQKFVLLRSSSQLVGQRRCSYQSRRDASTKKLHLSIVN
jgi:hypothetical protein